MNRKSLLAAITASALVTGCATQTGPVSVEERTDRNNAAIGAVAGAVAGALIGGQLDDDGNRDKGVIVGALAGAAIGAGIGNVMDRQEDEFRRELEAEQQRSEIEIQRVRDDLLKLTFDSEVTFDFDSVSVKSSFTNSLNKVADVIQKYESLAEVVGHTDDRGAAFYNQQLSERRAQAVMTYLVKQGVGAEQLSARGMGEGQPRESNATEAGRALNRRVEIFVRSSS